MRDKQRTNEQTLKIELLSQWKLEAEFRNTINLYFLSKRLVPEPSTEALANMFSNLPETAGHNKIHSV